MPKQIPPRKGSRILFLGAQMATGGSQRVLLLQASWFFKRGYPVAVAFLYDKESLLPLWCSTYDFPIYDLGFASPTNNVLIQAAYFIRGMYRLYRLLRQTPWIAMETFAHHADLIGLPLAWLAGVPNRIASHRGKIEGLSPILERVHAVMVNSPITSCLVVVAERVRDDAIAEGIQPRRIVKIANGVVLPHVDEAETLRLRDELNISQDELILLSVGRLRYQKDHSALLRAFPTVLARFPNIEMLIAGDGLLREELQKEARSLGISDKVKFLGIRHDIPTLMSLADLFVFPSRFEGMPNAVLEAMSHSLPVIATAVQGVDEIIRDGENGLLVPVEDPVALSDAILRLLTNPEERRSLGGAARETIEKDYTVDRMCAEYQKLLMANDSRRK
jgi:glycosyltransferase involved in cell wall biosynthesis